MTSNARPRVVVCAPLMGADISPVRAFEPAVEVIDANAVFSAYHAAGRSGAHDTPRRSDSACNSGASLSSGRPRASCTRLM